MNSIFATAVVTWEFPVWCRNGKSFCERPFALQHQQPEKNMQNVDFPPLKKCLLTPMLTPVFFLTFGCFPVLSLFLL